MGTFQKREAWNKGKLVGQKPPLKSKDIWAIRIPLQNAHAVRDLAMFNLAIDSRLRGCDLVSLRVRDISHGAQILSRAMIIQQATSVIGSRSASRKILTICSSLYRLFFIAAHPVRGATISRFD